MADNSAQNGTDTIRDIDRAGVKTQVFAIDQGGAASEALVSGTSYLRTYVPDGSATGTITVKDSNNGTTVTAQTAVSVAPTAASYVVCKLTEGDNIAIFDVAFVAVNGTGVMEASFDSTTGTDGKWYPMPGRLKWTASPLSDGYLITTNDSGLYEANCAGAKYVRWRVINGTVTGGGFAVTIRTSVSIYSSIDNSLPTGSKRIGSVGFNDGSNAYLFKAGSTGPVSTDVSLPVSISPNSGFPAGFVRTSDEPRQIFYDPFDAALDTTNLWNTPTVGNSASIASVTTGLMSMGTGTTASGWSKLTSIPTFKPVVPAWLGYSFAIAIPDGAAPTANAYRFWGGGTIPGVPTTALPLTDAIGFELTTAGALVAVVYAGGTRTAVATLTSIGDASMHRYIVYARTDKIYWYVDGILLANLQATSNFQAPQIQTLPLAMLAVGGSTPPVSNSQITCSGLTVWDTGKNASQIADGTFPFRKLTVSSTGAASVNNAQINGVTPLMGNGVTGTGSQRVTVSSDNTPFAVKIDQTTPGTTNLVALAANQSVNVGQINAVTPLMGNGVTGTGSQRVTIASDNTAFSVNATTTPAVATTTSATLSSAASTNATSVKASAGNLYSISVSNTGAAAAFFKLYNKASAPTVGTDVPVLTISIAASGTVNVPFGAQGFRMATGIAFAITNLVADSDTTAVAAAQVKVMVAYI